MTLAKRPTIGSIAILARSAHGSLLLAVICVGLGVAFVKWFQPSDATLLFFSTIFMWIALSSSWNLISGFTGYVDFGHVAFFGVGAYTTGYLMVEHGWSVWATLPLALAMSVALAAVLGIPLLRIRGLYFSVAMLGVYMSLREGSRLLTPITGGAQGLTLPPILNRPLFYYAFLTAAVLTVWIMWWIRSSQFGLSLLAIREDEDAAEARGMDTVALKRIALCVSAGITSVVGGIWAYQLTYLEPVLVFRDVFLITVALTAVFGGLGTVFGPVVGSIIFITLRDTIWAHGGVYHTIFLGTTLVILILFLPDGLAGLWSRMSRRFLQLREKEGARDGRGPGQTFETSTDSSQRMKMEAEV